MEQPFTASTQTNPLFGGSTPAAPAPSGNIFSRPSGASEGSKDQSKDSTASKDGSSGGTTSPFTAFSLGGGGTTLAAPVPPGSLFGSQLNNHGGDNSSAPSTGSIFSRPPGASEASKDQSKDSTASKDRPSGGTASPFTAFGLGGGGATPAAPAPLSSLLGSQVGNNGGGNSSAPSIGGIFGRPPGASEASKDQSKDSTAIKDGLSAGAASPFTTFSLGANKDAPASKLSETSGPATSAPTLVTATTTQSAGPSVPAPSMLRGKTVEDIVNRWTTELETHTREFSHLASEVAVWDRTLIENGNYISALYATVLAAESTQASLDQSLDHVEQQQRHLTATLDQYEKSASEILHGPGGIMSSTEGLGLADSERDKSYALAANLYTQLDDLSRSLTQMVESVNCLNLSPGPSHSSGTADEGSQEDAISTIAGILNAHLSSLQWIDGSLKEMEGKVNDAERKIKDTGARGWSSSGTGEGTNKGRSYGLGTSRR